MSIKESLSRVLEADQIYTDEPMSRHTTFRTGGPADYLVTPRYEQMQGLVTALRAQNIPFTVIGNGSNLLVSDHGIRGVVIEIGKQMSEITVDGDVLHAQAGALMSAIAARALEAGLGGFECEAGIPGSIGGAAVMNAGAYGGELKDVLESVEVLTPEGELVTIPAADLDLSYRHSCIPEKGYLVVAATIRLTKADPEQIRAKMDELKEKRVSKQPLEYPSAGSTFKRPEGYFAGKLIEDAGLRGFKVGGAQVSEKHCGFVINAGGATSTDVISLMKQVREKVKEQFGVTLEPEVKFVGDISLQ